MKYFLYVVIHVFFITSFESLCFLLSAVINDYSLHPIFIVLVSNYSINFVRLVFVLLFTVLFWLISLFFTTPSHTIFHFGQFYTTYCIYHHSFNILLYFMK